MNKSTKTQSVSPKETTSNNKPAKEIRIGSICASIWANQHDSGISYRVTLSRTYRDGEEWKRTEGFNRDDLLTLAKVADLAHTWIWKQKATQS